MAPQFRQGDGRSRAAGWTRARAESLVKLAERLGLDAGYHGSAWGSQYVTVESVTTDAHDMIIDTHDIVIRVANHAEGAEYGSRVDVNVHNETPAAAKSTMEAARKAIRALARS